MPDNKVTNQDYINGIRNGDPTVITMVYKNYHQAIVHLVEKMRGTKEDAHDVFQEGLVMMYQKVQQTDFELTSSFLTYFYAVCRNIWLNRLKKKANSEVTLDDKMLLMLKEDTVPLLENSEQYFLYRKMFLRLGKDCQQVLSLFLEKVSMEKIMAKMGYGSISYTKKRKFLCKEKLVQLIKDDATFEELRGDY